MIAVHIIAASMMILYTLTFALNLIVLCRELAKPFYLRRDLGTRIYGMITCSLMFAGTMILYTN